MAQEFFKNLNFTIDSIYQKLIDNLTHDNRIRSVSDDLLSALDNAERVLYVCNIIKSYNLFPHIIKLDKCDSVSIHYRNLGNQYYQQANFYKAWQYYNMALLYAPLVTQNYGLAVANRSAAFAALKEYKACIEDIKLVFTIQYPDKIRDKLLKRQKQCEDALREIKGNSNKENDDVADILTFKGRRHDRYLSACSKLTVNYNEKMGRHVVANEDIEVGEILVQEEPYVKLLLKSQFLFACAHCLSRKLNLYPCPYCCLTLYCSRPCVEQAWDQYHSYECPLIASLVKLNFNKLERLALRTTIKAKTEHQNWHDLFNVILDSESKMYTENWGHIQTADGKYIFDTKYYNSIHTLATNIEKRDVSDIFQKTVSAAVLLHCVSVARFLETDDNDLKQRIKIFTAGTLLHHMMTAPTNMHSISTNVENDDGHFVEEYDIGSAPYAFLSLINHSCAPNVVRFTKLGSGLMTLIALRPIKKGMQVFDNYGYAEMLRDEKQSESADINICLPSELGFRLIVTAGLYSNKKAHHAVHTLEERQTILKSQYKFTCVCEACVDNWPVFHDLRVAANLPAAIVDKKNKFLSSSAIEDLQKADTKRALKLFKPLCELATALEPYIPCKEAAECQEALKQCLAIFAGVVPYGYRRIIEWGIPPPSLPGQTVNTGIYLGLGAQKL